MARIAWVVDAVGAVGAVAALAACSSSTIDVRAPSASVREPGRRWVMTEPVLRTTPSVAVSGDNIYVLSCAPDSTVSRISGGKPVWSRVIATGCYSYPSHGVPIAASELGVVAAASGDGGVHVAAFDRDGAPRWTQVVHGTFATLGVAAARDRFAICSQDRVERLWRARELDPTGAQLEARELGAAWTPGTCTFDEHGALWTVIDWLGAKPLRIGERERPLGDGAWAIRLDDAPRFLPMPIGVTAARVTTVPTGFIASIANSNTLAFVDLDGKTSWQLVGAPHGCSLYPAPITGTPTRLLAAVTFLCDERGGTAELGDLTVANGDGWDGKLHTVIVDYDMTSPRARTIHQLADVPHGLGFAETPRGVVAFGEFSGALGLGTGIHSADRYACTNDAPSDSSRSDTYETTERSCPDGYRLRTDSRAWPVIALLALH